MKSDAHSSPGAVESPVPLVSVVIPTFNAAATVERALNSVASQTYANVEIIVSDDASADDTTATVRAWPGAVRLVTSGRNRGPAGARNAAIAAAAGKYVTFLDADDEFLPAKVEREVAVLERNPGSVLAVCDADWIDETGRKAFRLFEDGDPAAGIHAWKTLLQYSFIATPCVMARRDVVLQVGAFDERLLIAQDQDLWIRLSLAGAVEVVDDVLVRIHLGRASHIVRNAHREAEILLPMIAGHVERQRSRLSWFEWRRIMGSRWSRIGRNAYDRGLRRVGLGLLARAGAIGYGVPGNLLFVLRASQLGRQLKTVLRGSGAAVRGR